MEHPYDVVVAGGGIAGLTAGLTSARLGRKTLVLTGGLLGGQLVSIEKVEGFPGFPDGVPGYDLCPMTQEQAEAAGAEFMMAGAERIAPQDGRWLVTTDQGDILARAVILATGSTLKKLNAPGEQRLQGKGVSHCASCDAPLLRGRITAVVGGGDSAMQEALTLAAHAAKVIILQRENALTGQASFIDRATGDPKIEIRCGVAVTEIVGDTEVTHLRVQDVASGAPSDVETAAVFAYIGLQTNTAWLNGMLPLDSCGRIFVDHAMRTGLVGLCAAGNVRAQSPCRAVSAAGDGANAAIAVDRYLADGAWRD